MEMEILSSQQQEQEPLLEDDCDADHQIGNPVPPYCDKGINGLLSSKYVVACAAFGALGGLLFGYDQGVISVILVEPQFLQRFWQVGEDAPGAGFYKGLLTAMIEFGALLGAFNQGWIADWLSRKYSIIVGSMVFIFGSALQASATTYDMLVFARFVGGIGIGMLSMVAPLFISEISPPEIRGSLLVLEELSIVTGIVIAFWLTYVTRYIDSEWAWKLPFVLQILPGLLLGIGIYFLPFSPRWLVAKNRIDEALQSLCQLRQLPATDIRVLHELHQIEEEVALHRTMSTPSTTLLQQELVSWSRLFGKECWQRTRIGVGLMFFQQFVGINALIYYAPSMLKTLGLSYDMQLIMSGIINMAQLVGVLSSVWSMDRLGRRPLLLVGSLSMFICHLSIAVLVGLFAKDWAAHTMEGYVCVALLLLYMLAFGASWGPIPWSIPSEIFPSHLRAKGVAISACSNWANNFVIGLITPPLVQNTGYLAYLFFAFFCLLSFVWTYFIIPETSGKSLEDMDDIFNGK